MAPPEWQPEAWWPEGESGWGQTLIRRGFDDHGQLHGGGLHLDRCFGVGIERAVNDIRPVNQIGQRRRIEAETLLPDHGNETGTGLESRIVELPIALVALKMRGVGRERNALS